MSAADEPRSPAPDPAVAPAPPPAEPPVRDAGRELDPARSRFGPYRITERIGDGELGVIYRGTDLGLGRQAALKVIDEDALGERAQRDQFLREARTLAGVSHPNLISIYSIEQSQDGRLAMAMELLDGVSLAEAVKQGRFSRRPRDWVDYLVQAARGLQAAHRRNVVHRDIKPSSLLLTTSGMLKVGDFGLARRCLEEDSAEAPTESGVLIGTPAYMSPEACRGETLDHRSDMYSLAAVFYELITGQAPFRGRRQIDVVLAQLAKKPRPLRSLAPECSPQLARILERMLEKDPARRYASYRQLIAELEPQLPGALDPVPVLQRGEGMAFDLLVWLLGLLVLWAATMLIESFAGGIGAALRIGRHATGVVAFFGYYAWMMGRFGQTVGMMVFRAEVHQLDGGQPGWLRLIARFVLAYGPPLLLAEGLMLGWLWDNRAGTVAAVVMLWAVADVVTAQLNRSRRSLHDLLLGTWVVRRRPVTTRGMDDYVQPSEVRRDDLKRAIARGERIGPRTIVVGELGQGGMGKVLRGYDDQLERQVAVKLLSDELEPDVGYRERFVREARILANLSHDNLVKVYSFGQDAGRTFFTMELLQGRSLSQELTLNGPLDARRATRYLISAAEGLREAQRHGVIHRDIKPSNIILSGDGDGLKMVDFGLAKTTRATDESTDGLTATGVILGTPHYMSPEQAKGDPLDHKSDIYSLGASFYHLLTGTYPYRANSPMGILVKHITEPFPDRPLQQRVPPSLFRIIKKMMAKAPADRFADYDALLKELKAVLPAQFVPAGFWTRVAALTYDIVFGLLGWAIGGLLVMMVNAGMPATPPGEMPPPATGVFDYFGRHTPLPLLLCIAPAFVTLLRMWRRGETPGMSRVDLRLVSAGGMPLARWQRLLRIPLAPEVYVIFAYQLSGMAEGGWQIVTAIVLGLVLPAVSLLLALRLGRGLAEYGTRTYLIYK